MERREFLLKSASFLAGSLIGFGGLSRSTAFSAPFIYSSPTPRIAIIIDDIGYSLSRARKFFELEVPVTFSILPRLRRSHDLAIEIHERGHEVMLHQPMEPYSPALDPGPGALYVGFEPDKIIGIMEENLSEIPFVSGVNNHMGSKFTERREEMNETLKVVEKNNLFFIDSLTSSRSAAYKAAKGLHVASASRNFFLDNIPHEEEISLQLERLKRHALKFGRAIGIGHPFSATAEAIGKFHKRLSGSDIALCYVSDILPS